MSIREMIGADVESGGLFDPLGKGNSDREGGKKTMYENEAKGRSAAYAPSENSKSWLHEHQRTEFKQTDGQPLRAVIL